MFSIERRTDHKYECNSCGDRPRDEELAQMSINREEGNRSTTFLCNKCLYDIMLEAEKYLKSIGFM